MEPVATGLAISFGSQLLGGLFGGASQKRQFEAQQKAESQAIARQNYATIVRNHYMTGMMNMQLGLTKQQLAKQGADVRSAGLQAKGMLEAGVAATGTIGASSEAARSDIQSKLDAATQAVDDEWQMTLTNYNNDLESMRLNALNAVIQPRKYSYKGSSFLDNVLGAAFSVGGSFATNYALQSMRLDIGSNPVGNTPSIFSADYKTNIPSLNYLD